MEPLRLTYQEAIIYMTLINAAVGLVLGLIPLIVGIKKNKSKLGIFGLLSSVIGGAILGLLLTLPAIGVFLWLILKKPSTETTVEAEQIKETEVL